ncbi:hypothetical protein [Novosphingobium sp. CF614]|uniref:hypothetical protein n=1 Tax=Novosphingobium sp. CF614 TaxID=1884364 RepID=UPI0015A6BB60|nr:hypothetical protein [Novosphingobium sp. CF614]
MIEINCRRSIRLQERGVADAMERVRVCRITLAHSDGMSFHRHGPIDADGNNRYSDSGRLSSFRPGTGESR